MQPQNWNKAVIQNLQDMIITQADRNIFLRQSQKLKVLLTIPPKERTDEHIKQISVLVQSVKFISRYREKPYYNELCRNLYVKTFQQRKTIFKQGDTGTCFYVILSGLVKIYADEPTCFSGYFKKREVAVLGKGNCFGEIALFFGSQRTATVIAESDCDLLMLDKDVFQKYIQGDSEDLDLQSTNLKDVRRFLNTVQQFSLFTPEEIAQISTKCHKQIHQQQTILLKQGVVPKQLFIIKKGRVRVIKKIEVGYQYYELDELESGTVFGDHACITDCKSEYTYITSIASEIIHLNGFDLKQYISQEKLDKYVESIHFYPESETLFQMQIEDLQWKQYKKQIVQNVVNDKLNSRGFDRRMRLPELRYKLLDAPDQQIYQRTFVLQQSCRTPQHKQLFRREIETLRNQISPKRMKRFEQNYL
ncbi:unnamed protein product [Paramecium primaurelia]|uniref:Cyclic nucleotide-binding domain-containing protein n=1 Tax=Paramecium primaurelia TaxID=5886 RepID=A0A8S1PL01_PARPR|nr:unnamed protein product [Paramecium primaurelia]